MSPIQTAWVYQVFTYIILNQIYSFVWREIYFSGRLYPSLSYHVIEARNTKPAGCIWYIFNTACMLSYDLMLKYASYGVRLTHLTFSANITKWMPEIHIITGICKRSNYVTLHESNKNLNKMFHVQLIFTITVELLFESDIPKYLVSINIANGIDRICNGIFE